MKRIPSRRPNKRKAGFIKIGKARESVPSKNDADYLLDLSTPGSSQFNRSTEAIIIRQHDYTQTQTHTYTHKIDAFLYRANILQIISCLYLVPKCFPNSLPSP